MASTLPTHLRRGALQFELLARPDRRTLEITIERDASLTVKVPAGATVDQVEKLIDAKQDWIHRKLAEKHALWGAPVAKQLVDGEGFPYLGRTHRLQLVAGNTDTGPPVRLHRGRLQMQRRLAGDPDRAVDSLRTWYRQTGTPWLRRRLRPWADRLDAVGIEPHVTDLGFRWGSTRGRDRINVHWATLQHRPGLIDYVLVHELAHIHVAHHGQDFWRIVARVMPDVDDRRQELSRNGAATWMGALELA
jgi:predicted metal-dependent hydrolase